MEMTSDMLQKLTNLEHLTLCIKEKCTDRELLAFSKSLKNLQYLKVKTLLSVVCACNVIGKVWRLELYSKCNICTSKVS